MSSGAGAFFDGLYARFANDGARLRNSDIFNNKYDFDALKIKSNLYLHSVVEYRRLSGMIGELKVQFIPATAETVAASIGCRAFDAIFLSNLADYALGGVSRPNSTGLETFLERVLIPLSACLDERGVLVAAYVYAACRKAERGAKLRSAIDDPAQRRCVLSPFGERYQERYFEGIIDGRDDMVVVISSRPGI